MYVLGMADIIYINILIFKQSKMTETPTSQAPRILERENVIHYKKKPTDQTSNLKNPIILKPNHNNMPNNHLNHQEQDLESGKSHKSATYSQESGLGKKIIHTNFNNNNNPLPQLHRERKKIIGKLAYENHSNISSLSHKAQQFVASTNNNMSVNVNTNNYVEKEVRQHDNILLKQRNNLLSNQNMKLKTKIMALEKQNNKLQRIVQEESIGQPNIGNSKLNSSNVGQNVKDRINLIRQNNNLLEPTLVRNNILFVQVSNNNNVVFSLKNIIKNVKKELEELKKQNITIKSNVKFTSIAELEFQRDQLLQETKRLKNILDEEQQRKIYHKMNEKGVSQLEQKYQLLQEKNGILAKEINDLNEKHRKNQENLAKNARLAQNEKNLNKMLFNARRVIKQKQREVEVLKSHLKTNSSISIPTSSYGSIVSSNIIGESSLKNNAIAKQMNTNVTNHNNHNEGKRSSLDGRNAKVGIILNNDVKAKSIQKNVTTINNQSNKTCEKCILLQKDLKIQRQKNKLLSQEFKVFKEKQNQINPIHPLSAPLQPNSQHQIVKPEKVQLEQLSRFLTLRFKAHRLEYQESQKYLINCESQKITEGQLEKQMTVRDVMQSLFVQPFSIVSNRYLQIFIILLCFDDGLTSNSTEDEKSKPILINESKIIKKKVIIEKYERFIQKYEILNQEKEEEMFIQIAELITNYYQQILTALQTKRNGEGTIEEKYFREFFKEIQLEDQYIDFIITQIILESLDLEHINFYAMFEIFYMPNVNQLMPGQQTPNHNKNKKRFQVENSRIVQEEDQEFQESKSHLGSRLKTVQKKEENSKVSEEEYAEDEDYQDKVSAKHEDQNYEQQYEEVTPSKNKKQVKQEIPESSEDIAIQAKKLKGNNLKQKNEQKSMIEEYEQEVFEEQKLDNEAQQEEEKFIQNQNKHQKGNKVQEKNGKVQSYVIEDLHEEGVQENLQN